MAMMLQFALAVLLCVHSASSLSKSELFPYGRGQQLAAQDDVSSPEFQLSTPIVFYGTVYNSIYVNDNGLLSFLTDVPAFFNAQFPLTYPIIAPLYSDIDTRDAGRIYYRETQAEDLLERATRDIRNHFSKAGNFQARSLFIVTWDGVGYYDRGADKLNTVQVVLATSGEDTYAFFLYSENGVQWIQSRGKNPNLPDARAQAGFMSGDGKLYTLRGSGTEQARNFDRMSNVRTAGMWLFHIGRPASADGNVLPADLDALTEDQNTLDGGSSCSTTLLPCPPQSTCVDKIDQRGFCCVCKEPYMGNGRNCVEKNSTQRMNGKVNGIINDVRLDDADLHVYIVTDAGRTYTAVSRVPTEVGSDLQLLTPLGGIAGWLFAVSRSSAPNGFTVTGGAFNRTAEIEFPQSGDHVVIEETFLGPDVFNFMRVQVKIRGSVPSIPIGAKIEVPDYEEEYTRVSPGVIRSHASRSYRLEGNNLEVPFTLDQTINYVECEAPQTANTRLKVARNFIVYDAQEQIVRYAMTNKVSPLSVGDPCKEGRHQCGPNSNCVVEGDSFRCACIQGYQYIYEGDANAERATCIDVNECAVGRDNCHVSAECINLPGTFRCRCQPGYVGDGVNCERKKRCSDLNCDVHAYCVMYGIHDDQRPQCHCEKGYVGDGFTCRPTDADDCHQTNYCDPRAECVYNEAALRHECRCRAGYSGDGIVCVEDTCDVADNCSPHGDCIYDSNGGDYYCACKPGFSGDGYVCLPEESFSSCDVVNNCHPLAQCVYDSTSSRYLCRCNAGYQGDGQQCIRTDELTCDKVAICSGYAQCIRDNFLGQHICRCNDGYEGDGITCTPIDECNTVDNCDTNAQCVFDPLSQRYRCQCAPGYTGNGRECQPDASASCNVRNTCHEHATCIYDSVDLRYRCQCNRGYQGDGTQCEPSGPENVPCNVINTCSVRGECIYDLSARGYRCRCQAGYVGDGYNCRPLRSCREDRYLCDPNADCVQDNSGEDICQCRSGYIGDGISCTATAQHVGGYLVLAQGMSLLKVPVNPTKSNPGQLLLMEPHQTPVGLATDCQLGHLYWADLTLKMIRRVDYNGSDVKIIISKGMLSPEGVAVDWLGRTIYWTDSENDTIEVASLTKGYRKTLISDNLDNPRGIAVHPGLGKMYWSDWSRSSPKIEVANMDGTGRADFVNTGLGLPNMITIDYGRGNLYWTDSGFGRIEAIALNGQNRRVIYTPAAYPFGIAIHTNHIYWTDWEIKFLHRVDINGGNAEPIEIPAGGSGRMYGIVSLPSYCPAVGSPCAVDNGGCRYLCLPDGRGGRSCVCPTSSEDSSQVIECNEVV